MFNAYEELNLINIAAVMNECKRVVREINEANGWFEKERPFSADIALLHSEVSEAYEAYRNNKSFDSGVGKSYDKDAIGAELADVFIRLLDTCERFKVDLGIEFTKKIWYNSNREYRHGGKKE